MTLKSKLTLHANIALPQADSVDRAVRRQPEDANSIRCLTRSRSSMPGTFDSFISGNWLKNAVGSSRSMRTCSPACWDTHTRTGAPSPAVAPYLKEPVDDHGIADQIQPAVERKPRKTLGRSLVELEEDRKLVVTGYLLKISLDAGLITSLGHAGQLRQIDHSEQAFQGGRNVSERLFGPDRDELARKFGFRHLRIH